MIQTLDQEFTEVATSAEGQTKQFVYDGSSVPFVLESGIALHQYHLAYTTYGSLNAGGTNAVWIFHALTANSQPHDWWSGLVGKGRFLDPDKYFIVCVNTPGSCYGSYSPLDVNPATGKAWYRNFPFFTTRDLIRSYQPLRKALGIQKISLGIGGSMGGQQLLEWAIEEPELFENIVPIATNAIHSPWGIAFNTTQRMAIEADSSWYEDEKDGGQKGMEAARAIALLSYRTYDGYAITQKENNSQFTINTAGESEGGAASYQRYQGSKLSRRFNAYSYYTLSKTMDSHNVGRGRGSVSEALQRIKARTLVVGIPNDVLYPLSEQQYLATAIPGATLAVLESQFGHDGFLLEYLQLEKLLSRFLFE